MQLDSAVVQELRLLAVDGRSPAQMCSFLRSRLGARIHIIEITYYFREAFCLNLLDTKPIVTYTVGVRSEIEAAPLINEAVAPAIEQHRSEWLGTRTGEHRTKGDSAGQGMNETGWTETQWLSCPHPLPLSVFIRRNCRATDRKLRLFAVARCRHFCHELEGERHRRAVDVAEQYADGQASQDDLLAASEATLLDDRNAFGHEQWVRAGYASFACEPPGGDVCGRMFAFQPPYPHYDAELLRDIFGNPFSLVTFSPSWRTDTAVALAGQMYDSRDFSAMPILADALQDAGCDSDDILTHCRGEGPHVRGCWVVDLVLGKE